MLSLGGWRLGGAAAPAAPEPRPISNLPTIKCSNCGVDIQISNMADHLCMALNPEPKPAPVQRSFLERANTMAQPKSSGFLKPGRAGPPPRIDATAANKPFARPGQIERNALTPGSSYSDPSRLSPNPPSSGRSPVMKLSRSATSPMPGPYDQPSPELPTFDNPFPPFPQPTPKRSHTPIQSRPGTRGRQEQHYSPEHDRRMAPMSPHINGGANVMQKMDSRQAGPFDRRPSEGRPSFDRRPSDNILPAFERRPSDNKLPAFDRRPSENKLPAFDRRPSEDRQPTLPSFDRRPSEERQPTLPSFDRRPSEQTPTEATVYGLPATPNSRSRTRSRSSTTSSVGRGVQRDHLRQGSEADSMVSRSSAYSQQSYERRQDYGQGYGGMQDIPPVPRPQENPYGRSYERENPVMQTLSPENRSKTFPSRKESFPSEDRQRPTMRRPSEPREAMMARNMFSESPPKDDYNNDFKPSSFQQRAINPFSKAANQMAAAPDFQVERPMQLFRPGDLRGPESSLHTPSDSASSDGSSSSFDVRSASSMSSAPSDYGERSRPPPPPAKPSPIEQPAVSIDDFLAREMATGSRKREPRTPAAAPAPATAPSSENNSNTRFRELAHRARDLLWNNPAKAAEPQAQEEEQPQLQSSPERPRGRQQERPQERPQERRQEPPQQEKEPAQQNTWLASLSNFKPGSKVSPINESPDSPTDPAICRGLIRHERNMSRGGSISSGSHQRSRSTGSASGRRPMDRQQVPPPPPPPLPRDISAAEVTPGRRAAPPSRGNCRGCRQPIVGKCMKAADGSLTGRWHKACFACKTCNEPFQTADFYVLNNFPYCEQHYHALNGSLCQHCDRGIEGQYLETDEKQKFHPRCFKCSFCRMQLQDDYFEVGGKIFCERHAYSIAQQNNKFAAGGRANVERRRTRLMMM